MPNRRSRYSSEFRAEAVRLYRSVEGEKRCSSGIGDQAGCSRWPDPEYERAAGARSSCRHRHAIEQDRSMVEDLASAFMVRRSHVSSFLSLASVVFLRIAKSNYERPDPQIGTSVC